MGLWFSLITRMALGLLSSFNLTYHYEKKKKKNEDTELSRRRRSFKYIHKNKKETKQIYLLFENKQN